MKTGSSANTAICQNIPPKIKRWLPRSSRNLNALLRSSRIQCLHCDDKPKDSSGGLASDLETRARKRLMGRPEKGGWKGLRPDKICRKHSPETLGRSSFHEPHL